MRDRLLRPDETTEPRRTTPPVASPTRLTGAVIALQAAAGNRALTRSLVRPAARSTATLAREKKVKDDTQAGRIGAGQAAPTMEDVVSERLGGAGGDAGLLGHKADAYAAALKALLDDDDAVEAIVEDTRVTANQFWGKTKTPEKAADWIPTDTEIAEVVAEVKAVLGRAVSVQERSSAWVKAEAEKKFGTQGRRAALAGKLAETAATGVDKSALKRRSDELLARSQGARLGAKLTSKDRKAWAKGLRKLPAIADLAAMHKAKAKSPGQGGQGQDAKWKGGKGLIDDAVKLDKDAKNPVKLPDNDKMTQRIKDADAILRRIVEDAVLGLLPPPTINVHLQDEDHFRAYQSGSEVHVACNEPTPIVVHETGHYIEEKGPIESWADIQALMHVRHEEAGGGLTRKGPSGKSEGTYRGKYAATGPYTASTYKGGATEVMSMTIEYLANPKKFDKMIDEDPLQAALILRALAPTAYAAEGSLRPFDDRLPK